MRSIWHFTHGDGHWWDVSESEWDSFIADRTGFTSMAQLLQSHAERGYRPTIDVRDSFAVELGRRFEKATGAEAFRYGRRG
jgi:hypothetical protein